MCWSWEDSSVRKVHGVLVAPKHGDLSLVENPTLKKKMLDVVTHAIIPVLVMWIQVGLSAAWLVYLASSRRNPELEIKIKKKKNRWGSGLAVTSTCCFFGGPQFGS